MRKRKYLQIIGGCLFFIFCLLMVLANIVNILKEPIKVKSRSLTELSTIIARLNQEAPYQVGAERWFTKAELNGDTLVYEYELRCNELTERYYLSHEQDLRDLSLLSFKMVDEQRDLGTRTADVLLNNQVILKYKTILPSGKIVSYVYTGEDIAKITKGSSLTSEKALLSYVKTIIGAASASLPIVTTEDGEPVVDQVPDPLKYIILKDIQLQGKDVVFSFSTPEINFSVSDAKKGSNDEAEVKAILDELIKDQYFKEHINFFAMAKCNLIFRYKGARTSQSLEIRFPYAMLRESSYIPKYLLDENNF